MEHNAQGCEKKKEKSGVLKASRALGMRGMEKEELGQVTGKKNNSSQRKLKNSLRIIQHPIIKINGQLSKRNRHRDSRSQYPH